MAVYSLGRTAADDDFALAADHARNVLDVERWFHLDVEATLNSFLDHVPFTEAAASFWYASLHYTVTATTLVLLYRRHPAEYRSARTALVLATAAALCCYVAFPTAPPRLVGGYTDTLLATSHLGWWGAEGSAIQGAGSAVNELAAMPSMHVGWSLWCTFVLLRLARRRWQRVLAATYAPVTAFVVVATANHWLLDAVAGAGVMIVAWQLAMRWARQQPDAAAVLHAELAPAPLLAGDSADDLTLAPADDRAHDLADDLAAPLAEPVLPVQSRPTRDPAVPTAWRMDDDAPVCTGSAGQG